jgi:hypothetical protein
MKIYGPYLRKDKRLVIVINHGDRMQTLSYPKYLMEQHLGRKLLSHETVDHIDGNPLNNDLSNLQILSLADNIRKSHPVATYIELKCKCCGKQFKRREAVHKRNTEVRKVDGPFCSKSCVGKTHN